MQTFAPDLASRALKRLTSRLACAVTVALVAPIVLGGCTVTVGSTSLLPKIRQPVAIIVEPAKGYVRQERMLVLPGLGTVHIARLTRPGNAKTLVYSGGNGSFVATAGRRLNQLAELSGADIVTFDYPGRGGTTVPKTTDALIAFGPALIGGLRHAGWITSGPVYSYGLSLGGATASNIARTGGFAGLILEATASDIPAVASNMIPRMVKPFVRVRVSNDLKRYDYLGYAVAAHAPILLIAGQADMTVDFATAQRFAIDLRSAGAGVTFVEVPGGHGAALASEQGQRAVRGFLQ